jgi:hypothetical protein
MGFNDSNLSVCKHPTSTVGVIWDWGCTTLYNGVVLIVDANWLKPCSSRCLFHKLTPAKAMMLKCLFTVPSHWPIHCLISPTREFINLISTVKKKHLDIISPSFSTSLWFSTVEICKNLAVCLRPLQHGFNIEIQSPLSHWELTWMDKTYRFMKSWIGIILWIYIQRNVNRWN